jgi:hypothetical protein
MDDSQTVGGGPRAEISLVDYRHRQTAQCGIPGNAGAVNARPDDEQVVRAVKEPGKIASHAPTS